MQLATDVRCEEIPIFYTGAATFLSNRSSFILTRAEWTPIQTHCYSENLAVPGIEPGTSGLAAQRRSRFNKQPSYLHSQRRLMSTIVFEQLSSGFD
jgi:hypothetical protein